MRRLLFAWIAVVYLAFAGAAQAQTPPDPARLPYARPGGRVDIGGRRIDLRCIGSGGPTVVLMAGLGAFSMTWYKVHPTIAKRTRTCAFDRASFGHSDPAPLPQSIPDVVEDLHAVLKAAKIPGPYVLVAHSMAGIEARLFAQRWPDNVAGMVLVDGSFADQRFVIASLLDQVPANGAGNDLAKQLACIEHLARPGFGPSSPRYKDCADEPPEDAPADLRAVWPTFDRPSAIASTITLWGTLTTRALESVDRIDFGAKPLVVLTADKTWPADSKDALDIAMRPIWLARHEALSRLSSRGVHIFVPGAGHRIQGDRPDVVIAAVNRVLDELAAEAHPHE